MAKEADEAKEEEESDGCDVREHGSGGDTIKDLGLEVDSPL